MFDSINKKRILKNKANDELYSMVGSELENGIRHNGLWIKAKANALGDEKKVEALYIKYRVEEIKDDLLLCNIANNENPKEISNEKHSEDITPTDEAPIDKTPIDKVTDEVVELLRKRDRVITILNNKYVVSPTIEQTSLSKFLLGNKISYYDNIEDVIDIYAGASLNS